MNKFVLSLVVSSTVVAASAQASNYWWETDNSGSRSQVYSPKVEKQAFDYAQKATKNSSYVQNNVWMNETFGRQGPNKAYGLVRTQNQLTKNYSACEEKQGTLAAQQAVMANFGLSEDDLLAYVLQLSLLDR